MGAILIRRTKDHMRKSLQSRGSSANEKSLQTVDRGLMRKSRQSRRSRLMIKIRQSRRLSANEKSLQSRRLSANPLVMAATCNPGILVSRRLQAVLLEVPTILFRDNIISGTYSELQNKFKSNGIISCSSRAKDPRTSSSHSRYE